MAYKGYWRLGETEIINSARTAAYVGALAPTFGLEDCNDCDGLAEALGDSATYGPEQRILPGTVVRTNYGRNVKPSGGLLGNNVVDFSGYVPGTGETGATTVHTGEYDGVMVRGQRLPYARRTVTAPKTGGSTGWQSTAFNYRAAMAGVAGEKVTVSVYLRYGGPTPIRIRLRTAPYATGGSSTPGFTDSALTDLPSGQWVRISSTHTALTDFETVGWWAYLIGATSGDQVLPAGSVLDISGLLIERGGELGEWFDGDSYDTLALESGWAGTPNRSISTLTSYDTVTPLLSDDSYRTPAIDNAPWIDTSNPALNDFWGVYPLNVSGVDDSTRVTSVTELITDGAVVSRPRAASREIRYDVLLMGRDKHAVYEGLHWLNRALDANRCDSAFGIDCTGTPLNFFSACPPGCDYSACPDSPVEWTREVERVNWVTNPTPTASSTGNSYVSTNGSTVSVTPTGARADWSGTVTFGQTGIVQSPISFQPIVGGPQNTWYPSGTVVSGMIDYIEVSRPGLQVQVFIQLRSGTTMVQQLSAVVLSGSTSYFGTTIEGTANVAFDNFRMFLVIGNANTPVQAGDYLIGSRWMFETAPSGKPYFYGWTRDSLLQKQYVWYGLQESSPSVQYAAPDDGSLWSITPAPLQSGARVIEWGQQWDGCPPPYDAGLRLYAPNSGVDITATRVLEGLIPGQWYKVDVMAVPSNDSGFVMSLRGTEYSLNVANGFNMCGNVVAPASLWFQANAPVMFLDMVMSPPDDDPRDQWLLVRRLNVTRATADFNVYQTQFPNDGSILNGWSTGTPPPNFSFTIERDQPFLNDVSATFVNLGVYPPPGTIPAGQVIVHRYIRGLVPGNSYRAIFNILPSTGVSAAPPMTLALEVDDAGQSTVVWNPTTDFGSITLVHDFIATKDYHDVALAVDAAYSVTGTTSALSVGLLSFSVERQEGSVEIPYPDAAEDYRRTLYQVTALTGPTIVEEYDKQAGYMVRVQFGLVAGVPHQFGPLVDAGSALGGSSSPLQQVDCIAGQAVRTNLAPNPSFEVAPGMWVGTFGPTRQLGQSFAGLWRGQHAAMQTGSAFSASSTPVTIPITPGNTYTFSGYFKANVVKPTRVILWVQYLNSVGGDVGFSVYSDYVTLTSEYQRVQVASLAPAGAVSVRLNYGVNVIQGVNFAAADTVDVDAFQFEIGGVATPYFDGSRPNAAWTGTPHQSASIYTPSEVSDLVDPDCPPLPAPPAPPSIDEECIVDPASWTRYTIDIPATAIPRFSSVLPVVLLRTGNASARQLRMRWYPNPDGLNITELPPCGYEGEVIVSYVPPRAEMVVDAIAREATASINDGPEQQATQLLYGPDGGPMVWPELRCNQSYIFTVDVDSADSVDELDILLSLGLKV